METVAMLVLSCVMVIHLGLVDAVLRVLGLRSDMPLVTCPKCLTFWTVLVYAVIAHTSLTASVATAFVSCYIAVWLDLFLGIMDLAYERLERKFFGEEKENG